MKLKSYFLIAAIIALLSLPASNAKVITGIDMPFATSVLIPCAARGAGEIVDLVGVVHAVFSVTQDANGGQHVATHINLVGVSGIGLTTGDKYQAAQADSFVSNSGTANEFTFVNNFLMTARGPGNNLRVHELVHVTVNANGIVTAEIENMTVDCR